MNTNSQQELQTWFHLFNLGQREVIRGNKREILGYMVSDSSVSIRVLVDAELLRESKASASIAENTPYLFYVQGWTEQINLMPSFLGSIQTEHTILNATVFIVLPCTPHLPENLVDYVEPIFGPIDLGTSYARGYFTVNMTDDALPTAYTSHDPPEDFYEEQEERQEPPAGNFGSREWSAPPSDYESPPPVSGSPSLHNTTPPQSPSVPPQGPIVPPQGPTVPPQGPAVSSQVANEMFANMSDDENILMSPSTAPTRVITPDISSQQTDTSIVRGRFEDVSLVIPQKRAAVPSEEGEPSTAARNTRQRRISSESEAPMSQSSTTSGHSMTTRARAREKAEWEALFARFN